MVILGERIFFAYHLGRFSLSRKPMYRFSHKVFVFISFSPTAPIKNLYRVDIYVRIENMSDFLLRIQTLS